MKKITKIALAAALSSVAMAASAMSPIQDNDLSQVTGQDGVSIAANLNVNIGSFVYSTPNGAEGGGSIGFNNVAITGTVAATLDILSANSFFNTTTGGEAVSVLGLVTPTTTAGAAALAAFYPGTDVVRIAIPDIATTNNLNVKVGSVTMGVNGVQPTGAAPSFGSFAMNNIQLQGTTAYIWAH